MKDLIKKINNTDYIKEAELWELLRDLEDIFYISSISPEISTADFIKEDDGGKHKAFYSIIQEIRNRVDIE